VHLKKAIKKVKLIFQPVNVTPLHHTNTSNPYHCHSHFAAPELPNQKPAKRYACHPLVSHMSSIPHPQSQASRRLPPITPPRSKSDFAMPTKKELRKRQKETDAATVDHSYTNPNCQCFLCKMDDTLEMSGPDGFGSEMQKELTLSQQVSIGDRVIIQIKKSSELITSSVAGKHDYLHT